MRVDFPKPFVSSERGKKERMKAICFVLTSPFAANAFLLGHLKALAENYRVTLCVNLEAYPLSDRLDPRVRVVHLPIARKISVIQDLRALLSLMMLFRHENFDAVHSITPKAGLLAMCASFLCGVRRRHHTFTGQVWATRTGVRRAFLKAMDRLIVAFSTRVFSDSCSQSKFLEAEGIGRQHGISVLGKGSIAGVAPERFRPDAHARHLLRESLGVSESSCVFLYVGRIARDKGVFDLVAAFSMLVGECENAALWIVGPDDEALQKDLQLAAGHAANKIVWVGPTFEPERYMASADVFVLPSYREGFGMVIIESGGCGIPTIAYRVDGVVDAVVDGVTGLLLEAGDIPRLAETMQGMVRQPDFRHQLGRQARVRVCEDFSDRSVTDAWVAFYGEAMAS